ncbi:MAG: PPK2 family polyphosphate--nucleotide phosphotransferase [Phycisphaerae bacterium]
MKNSAHYRVKAGSQVRLDDLSTDEDGGLSKDEGQGLLSDYLERLVRLQELLYAEGRHALLVVLQAMDGGGKDSTIRAVFGPVNPQGCSVVSFKAPHELERRHDFLWRVHQQTPPLGHITIFNRSHYEDVLIVRVKGLVPEDRWQARYAHINAFEEMLHDEGTVILKFFLHISKDYQKQRMQRRLDNPEKHWKFNPADLTERERWGEYMEAYAEALGRCSTKHAPWYVIPAECRWYRNLLVTRVLVETLESLDMKYPEPTFDASEMVVR